jgi:hypothetical protein
VTGIPDIDLFTSVRAKKLRFETVPETQLRFDGEPAHDSQSKVERENLPEEVEPGVTYNDVRVRWSVQQRIVHPTDPDQLGGDSGPERPEEDSR